MHQRPTYVRYRVALALMLAAAFAYLCRNAVGVAEKQIRTDLGLTLEQSGWFMAAFFWPYALFQVPAGRFAQKTGTRLALSLFAAIWAVAMIGCGLANGLWMLLVAQLFMGTAQAGAFPAACNTLAHWIPLSQRSTASGLVVSGMQVGAIAAGALTGYLILPLGWKNVFLLFAIPSLIWAVWFYVRFRNYPEQDPQVSEAELMLIRAGSTTDAARSDDASNESRQEAKTDWLQLCTTPTMLFLCGQQICRSFGYMFFASWFPSFLQQVHEVSVEVSGYIQSIVLCGTMLGGLAGGYVIDWIWRKTGSLRISRTGAGCFALGMSGLLILASWATPDLTSGMVLLAVGAFFAAIAGPAMFATVIDTSGSRVPQVFGTLNMVGNLAAAACPIIVGKFFAISGNWNQVLLLFASVYIVGAISWLFVDTGTSLACVRNEKSPLLAEPRAGHVPNRVDVDTD